jgi:hypothetical protein
MPIDSIKPLLRSAVIGFCLGLIVVATAGYTLARADPPVPVQSPH